MQKKSSTVAVIGNPTSGKGRGEKAHSKVLEMLRERGNTYGFEVIDLTGSSFEDSLAKACHQRHAYDYLVVVGGDGMVSLGVNAVGGTGKPLGIVAIGSGNDFARCINLPVNRIETAVDGIVGAIMNDTHIDVDMGQVTSIEGSEAVDTSTGAPLPTHKEIDRCFVGMLSCGLDATINDHANHSKLPNGPLRYFAALLSEVKHMKHYGFHVKATLTDGTIEERDIISPLLTVGNSRLIGGGIEMSPYGRVDDGLLDLIWMEYVPSVGEVGQAITRVYNGKLLRCRMFSWRRISEVEITRAAEGDEPPILMADGEYIGRVPVKVRAVDQALRVMVPPAVVEEMERHTEQVTLSRIHADGRDPITGEFVAQADDTADTTDTADIEHAEAAEQHAENDAH